MYMKLKSSVVVFKEDTVKLNKSLHTPPITLAELIEFKHLLSTFK